MELEYFDDFYYLDFYEYVCFDGEMVIIGLSVFVVDELGDIVFVELFEEGDKVEFE